MGQWGAYGYAVDHGWSGTQILQHFYGGTTMPRLASSPRQQVYLTGSTGLEVLVANGLGRLHTSIDGYAGEYPALRIRYVDSTHFQVYSGPGCGGPWTAFPSTTTGSTVRVKGAGGDATEDPRAMIQRCGYGFTRYYRGDMLAIHARDSIVTVNDVDTESLVRSVIPREVSPSWADAGGGRGAAAVRAQAVAARSYAIAGDTRWAGYATTCDSVSCQVYAGYGTRTAGSSTIVKVEDPRTDLATSSTARQIRMASTGRVARTEFSASTGGWSAGGEFPAVRDDGDDTAPNSNHTWSVSFSRSSFEAAFDRFHGGDVGTYEGTDIVARNGLGADGGRVLTLRARFTNVDVTLSGDQLRSLLGLRSNWFSVT